MSTHYRRQKSAPPAEDQETQEDRQAEEEGAHRGIRPAREGRPATGHERVRAAGVGDRQVSAGG